MEIPTFAALSFHGPLCGDSTSTSVLVKLEQFIGSSASRIRVQQRDLMDNRKK